MRKFTYKVTESWSYEITLEAEDRCQGLEQAQEYVSTHQLDTRHSDYEGESIRLKEEH